ncbi:MAG: DUF1569 domain-containing protein [Planctomycetes bacterium]|nr:DUF1569 domain-containing protein [Planctomycetota bacterium]
MLLTRPHREIEAFRALHASARNVLAWDAGRLEEPARGVSEWSAARHLVHLALVNEAAFDHIEALLDGRSGPCKAGGRLTLIGALVLGTGWIPRGKGKAPQRVVPPGEARRREADEALRRSEDRLEALAPHSSRLRSAPGRVHHFVFGDLTAAQWLRMARVHARHHLRIVRYIERAWSAARARG